VNIYEAKNMYWDKNGYPIPSMREHGKVVCSIRDENLVERVYGRGNGGQWDCFVSRPLTPFCLGSMLIAQ
jgi:hypothetical protein